MRTKKAIDLGQIEEMASEFCTQEEIARDMHFNRSLFTRRKDVKDAFEQGKNGAKMSLRHFLFRAAKSGDRAVLIFLAKNELGYRDNPKEETSSMPETGAQTQDTLIAALNTAGKEAFQNGMDAPADRTI